MARQRRNRNGPSDADGFRQAGTRDRRDPKPPGGPRPPAQPTQSSPPGGGNRLPRGSVPRGPWSCGRCGAADNWPERCACRICGARPPTAVVEAQANARKAMGTRGTTRQPEQSKIQSLEAQVRELRAKLDGQARSGDARGPRPEPAQPMQRSPQEQAAETKVAELEKAEQRATQAAKDCPGSAALQRAAREIREELDQCRAAARAHWPPARHLLKARRVAWDQRGAAERARAAQAAATKAAEDARQALATAEAQQREAEAATAAAEEKLRAAEQAVAQAEEAAATAATGTASEAQAGPGADGRPTARRDHPMGQPGPRGETASEIMSFLASRPELLQQLWAMAGAAFRGGIDPPGGLKFFPDGAPPPKRHCADTHSHESERWEGSSCPADPDMSKW